ALPAMRRIPLIRRRVRDTRLPKLSLQSKIVLLTTFGLLIIGAVGFLVLEWKNTMRHLDPIDRFAAAVFQSMAARTAGFNSIETTDTTTSTQFWTILLMLIGGSPGSVAGGI